MSLRNDPLRKEITEILTDKRADYIVNMDVANAEHGRCVEFVLPNIQTVITLALEEDWYHIASLLSDRFENIEYRKKGSFIEAIYSEVERSLKKKCACDMATSRSKVLYRESEAKAKEEIESYKDTPYQYSQKEAVDWVNKIVLDHSIANAETRRIKGPEGTCVEINFTSWGMPMLVVIDPVWVGEKTPKIALFENYRDTPTYITNGAGGYTKPRAFRWFMAMLDNFLTQRDEKKSKLSDESFELEAEAEKLRGEFNEEIRENEAMAPTDEGTLVGNLDHVRKADKILEKAEENCAKDIQDKAVEMAEERGYTDTAEKIKSEGLFSEMKKCQLKSANNCKLCCFGKSCPQSLLNAAMRPIKPKPKAKKLEPDPNWLNASDAVEALLATNDVSFTTESMSGGNYRISAHEGDNRIEILFRLNPDLTNDVTLNRWKDGDKSPYDETMIPVRDICSCNHLLNTVVHYIKDMKEAADA
jgi:hypothetical protein